MFDAAADQFTPDHSPLDWVVIQIVRAAAPGAVRVEALRQAEALTRDHDLVLGAIARDLLIENEIAAAAGQGDLAALTIIEASVRRRLTDRRRRASGLDWAVDQIAMARLATARASLTGAPPGYAGLALFEAAEAARDHGALAIAASAEGLVQALAVRA